MNELREINSPENVSARYEEIKELYSEKGTLKENLKYVFVWALGALVFLCLFAIAVPHIAGFLRDIIG